ncbi:TAXI family TRAP transporter solute-binding subunit [Polaromonas sp. YR568]|uniref:TAXI family TRAP transporter solute-binding subunit n=1 Tax=Polaromonas sp. YR568 TaxID=1855301 RepID=UPI00398BF9C2
MKLLLLYRRRWWLFYLPVLLCTALALWWSATQWKLLPPTEVVIGAGSPQGGYSMLAQRYAEQLERIGVRAEIVYSDTQKGSLERLTRAGDATSIGFAHGIYANADTGLQALAVIGQEPVWIFSTIGGPSSLAQARGLRVAAGPASSSSFIAARLMLEHAGVRPAEVQFDSATGVAAANALADGKADLVFQAAGEDSQAVQLLTRNSGIQLLGAEHAGAIAAQNPRLQPLLLPQGAIELRGDIPPKDLTLMSLQTHLLVRPGVHPALQRALLDAAIEIHEIPNFLQRHGQFPSFRGSDFPLSPTARAYSLGARPWMETLLPYRTAQYAELVFYAILPILAIAVLMLAWIPKLFDWRISSALNHFYGDLKFLENDMDAVAADNPMALRQLLERLDNIERQVVATDLPDEFSERWYTLREHLASARDRLLKLRSR